MQMMKYQGKSVHLVAMRVRVIRDSMYRGTRS